MVMNWRWTWVNFVVSLFINRMRFLFDEGLYHLHGWISIHPGTETSPEVRHIDFYSGALIVATILSLFQLKPSCYGVVLPSMPDVAHTLQGDHVVPHVDPPDQGLTRKVFLLPILNLFDLIIMFTQVSAGQESFPLPRAFRLFCHRFRLLNIFLLHPHG